MRKKLITMLIVSIFMSFYLSGCSTSGTQIDNTALESLYNLPASDINLEKYNQIENGMAYEEVKNIIGSDGTSISAASFGDTTSEIYQWTDGKFGNATISFVNGKVSSKSQFGLTANTNSSDDNITDTDNQSEKTEEVIDSENVNIAENETKEIQSSDLFENVYVHYANREKPFIFEGVKSFAQSSGYQINIIEPTEQELGEIKMIDSNGDYVYFCFLPIDGVEIIRSVSYYHSINNSEVTFSNYSQNDSPEYDQFAVHNIGDSPNYVNNIDEQREFLFG